MTAADEGATLVTPDGRSVRYYDSGAAAASAEAAEAAGKAGALTLVWHHGTPQTGRLLAPVLAAAEPHGLRVVSVARPGYEGSTRVAGRTVADAARDALAVIDALGVERFVTVGASGGGPHALALAALAGARARGVATFAGLAPYSPDDDWFAGMADPSGLRAATAGLAARTSHAETAEFDDAVFTSADHAALSGGWRALGADAGRAGGQGPEGEIDDDCAYVRDWGVGLDAIEASVLIVQGEADRIVPAGHAARLLGLLPRATSWWLADDGHISVLRALPQALDWLVEHAPAG